MVVPVEPMQAFVITMGVVIALIAAGGFYSLHRVRQIDRKLDQQKH